MRDPSVWNGLSLFAALLLLFSCTEVPETGRRGPVASGEPIGFSISGQLSKGQAPITTLAALAQQDFSVSAWYTPEGETFDVPGGTAVKYFENHRFGYVTGNLAGLSTSFPNPWRGVKAHGTTGAVTADPVYWPLDGTLSFFCYAPYREADSDIALEDPVLDDGIISRLPGYLPGSPLIRVTPAARPSDQIDFLAAPPLLDKSRTDDAGKFPLDFSQHRLTQVEFLFNYDGQLDDADESTDETKETVRITSVEIKNVVSSKYLYFTESGPHSLDCAWSDSVSPEDRNSTTLPVGSYRIDAEAGELITGYAASLPRANPANDNHRSIVPANGKGRVYLLPQELSEDVELEISYAIYEKHGVTLKVSDLVTLKLKSAALSAWPMGKRVRYFITLQIPPHQNSTFTVQVYPWKDSGNQQGPGHELLPGQ